MNLFLCQPHQSDDCFQTSFPNTVCHWTAKQIAPPQTHAIGWASVAMLLTQITRAMFLKHYSAHIFAGNQPIILSAYSTRYENVFHVKKKTNISFKKCIAWIKYFFLKKSMVFLA